MGFFASLFGNLKPANVEVIADRIWKTTDAKFAGLAQQVAARSNSETVAILLVAHFPDVLARLEELAAEPTAVPVMAVSASNLSIDIAAALKLDASATVDIIVGERHPLPSADERVEQFAGQLPCRYRLSHYLSLDDALLRVFVSAWAHDLLDKLGMREDEAIESRLVSRRMKRAQQVVADKAVGNSDAESAAQWLEKNCPDLGSK